MKLIMDSGAHSINSRAAEVGIEEYIHFLKESDLENYVNLDVITADGKKLPGKRSAELSLQNQRKMEEAALFPMPVFHRGEPLSYLEFYVANYDYIGIGMGPSVGSLGNLLYWLDKIFSEFICGKVKVHGFGMSRFDVLHRYPWTSVDSTTWLQLAAYGQILIPPKRNGKWSYHHRPELARVSTRGQKKPVQAMARYYRIRRLAEDYLGQMGVMFDDLDAFKLRADLNAMYFYELSSRLNMDFYFAGNGRKAERIDRLKGKDINVLLSFIDIKTKDYRGNGRFKNITKST